ncbi:MAG TPA: GNAT family N-acetyltransferase [Gaiellales bacterium]|nr:GNAT family N-acetyltransferase [Gaiellales bacterium]
MQSRGSTAFRIETARLVIRCWDPSDAGLAKEAIDTSLDHLRPWMPWAEAEPTTLDQKRQLLTRFAEDFARGDDAVFGIFEPDERRVVGGTGLHPRLHGNAREIGYWIRADATGRGLAGESTAALTRVAFEVDGVDRMEIHCDPANVRSAAIPRRLGYEQADGVDGNGHLIFRMLRDAYPSSPAANAAAQAYDDAGARVL